MTVMERLEVLERLIDKRMVELRRAETALQKVWDLLDGINEVTEVGDEDEFLALLCIVRDTAGEALLKNQAETLR